MKTKRFLATIAIAVIALTGCKKEGPAGKDGKDGNANVISSNTVTLNNWSSDFDDGVNYQFSSSITWSTISQTIAEKGVVLAYISDGSASEWYALPLTQAENSFSTSFNYSYANGGVIISVNGFDNSGSPNPSDFNGYLARIVAIPASQFRKHENVDVKSYDAVKKAFQLSE